MGIFFSHLVIGATPFEVVYNTRQDFSISPDFIGSFFDFCQPFLYTMDWIKKLLSDCDSFLGSSSMV